MGVRRVVACASMHDRSGDEAEYGCWPALKTGVPSSGMTMALDGVRSTRWVRHGRTTVAGAEPVATLLDAKRIVSQVRAVAGAITGT